MSIPTISRVTRWYCPNCKLEQTTTEPKPHTRMHACPKMYGLTAPMLPAGTKAKVEAKVREDYEGDEVGLTYANGKPIMSIVTTRDNGQDVAVFPGTATAKGVGRNA